MDAATGTEATEREAPAVVPSGKVLGLYADRAWMPVGAFHVPLLYPFWGQPPENPEDPLFGAYDRWVRLGPSCFRMESAERADYFVLPFDWREVRRMPEAPVLALANAAARQAKVHGKRLLVFYWSDPPDPVPLEGAVVFRTSLERGPLTGVSEFCQPGWYEDPVRWCEGGWTPPSFAAKPRISFCGHSVERAGRRKEAAWRLKELARTALGARHERFERLRRTPIELRREVLRTLAKSRAVDTDFVVRERFYGGASATGRWDFAKKTEVRREYVANIMGSPYVACMRGAGNYSYRYFETLACGRIPLVIDTGGGIPYDFEVDWRARGPWVPVEEFRRAPQYLLEFHRRFDAHSLAEFCRENRELSRRWLSPEGFFASLHRHFEARPRGR
jgi:hypothetical protein